MPCGVGKGREEGALSPLRLHCCSARIEHVREGESHLLSFPCPSPGPSVLIFNIA